MNFNLKQELIRNLANIPGWHTKRKIVVIESDDWGSIRMPSREVYLTLLKKGFRVDENPFNRYDSLASEEDLTALFEVLNSVKDKNNKPAIITANTIVANPDFEKIRKSNFQDYHYEPFTETLKRYSAHSKSFDLWKEGINNSVFRPQFHGREHLNVIKWMKALADNTGNVRMAFDNNMFDISSSISKTDDSFLEALNLVDPNEIHFQKQSLADGLKLFENIFNYQSKTFIAPCYIWSSKLNSTLKESGVLGIQGNWNQLEPSLTKEKRFKTIKHFTGQTNEIGQYYTTRNVHFEPSYKQNFDWISDTLFRTKTAFRWGKPAIISSHRMNFIGFIDAENRDRNLFLFARLLKEIVKNWPDVEFTSSDELFKIFKNP
ncbi:MAG: hypothetical protein FD170_3582 [Bacteroidetes bacterium]|nr:MAG: hypothetical protein FD170_3582 [Bacteroidota bacterium]